MELGYKVCFFSKSINLLQPDCSDRTSIHTLTTSYALVYINRISAITF